MNAERNAHSTHTAYLSKGVLLVISINRFSSSSGLAPPLLVWLLLFCSGSSSSGLTPPPLVWLLSLWSGFSPSGLAPPPLVVWLLLLWHGSASSGLAPPPGLAPPTGQGLSSIVRAFARWIRRAKRSCTIWRRRSTSLCSLRFKAALTITPSPASLWLSNRYSF